MRDHNDGVFLKKRADADRLHTLLPCLVILNVEAHENINLPDRKQLQAVDLRATHFHRDVETVFFVGAFGHRLIQTAVLSLRKPVALEGDFLLGSGQRGGSDDCNRQRRARSNGEHRF